MADNEVLVSAVQDIDYVALLKEYAEERELKLNESYRGMETSPMQWSYTYSAGGLQAKAGGMGRVGVQRRAAKGLLEALQAAEKAEAETNKE